MLHTAFEVEDTQNRKNYIIRLNEQFNTVDFIDSSIGSSNNVIQTFEKTLDKTFPFECNSGKEYFDYMLNKARNPSGIYGMIIFLGYVDPETYQPIEEQKID